MNEKRIVEILFNNLSDSNKTTRDAVINTRKEVIEEILNEDFFADINNKDRKKLILKINEAHSKLGYFLAHSSSEITQSNITYLEHLKFMYRVMAESWLYIHDHYNEMPKELTEINSINFKHLAGSLLDGERAIDAEFALNGKLVIEYEQFVLMGKNFELILCYLFSGADNYNRFAETTTASINSLKRHVNVFFSPKKPH